VQHALQCAFMQMSRDETLRTVGAACFQNTGAASFRLRGIVHGTIFARELFAFENLLGRAAERIRLFVVLELTTVE